MSNRQTNTWRARASSSARSRLPSRGPVALRGLLVAARVLVARLATTQGSADSLGRWASDKRRVLRYLAERGPRPIVELPLGWLAASHYAQAVIADLVRAELVEVRSEARRPAMVAITASGRSMLQASARDVGLVALEHSGLTAGQLEQATAVLAEVTRAMVTSAAR
jgi:DNA-binding MarR family transcriptional regulator